MAPAPASGRSHLVGWSLRGALAIVLAALPLGLVAAIAWTRPAHKLHARPTPRVVAGSGTLERLASDSTGETLVLKLLNLGNVKWIGIRAQLNGGRYAISEVKNCAGSVRLACDFTNPIEAARTLEIQFKTSPEFPPDTGATVKLLGANGKTQKIQVLGPQYIVPYTGPTGTTGPTGATGPMGRTGPTVTGPTVIAG